MSSYYSRVPMLAAVLVAGLVAQDDTIKVDVDLVNVLCTVRGKNNGLIGNLDKGDFHLFEDGKEQEIKYFTRETDLPLTIGLLVDVSGSQERLIDTEHRAASQFFRSVLRPRIGVSDQLRQGFRAAQDSTNSAKLLEEGLKGLRLNAPVGGLHPGPVPTQQNQAGTVLWDAVYLAANERLKGEVGRKVIVVITDGVDTGSRKTREQAIREAQLADTVVYSVYYTDPGAYGGGGLVFGGGGGEGELKKMSDETGGRVLKVDRKNTLDDLFKEIQDEMRTQYAIAYSPTNPRERRSLPGSSSSDANKDQKVQARKGYYAVAN
jgi:VWFA-related protein